MGTENAFNEEQNHVTYYITDDYSQIVTQYNDSPLNMGRMNDPSGSAWVKGLCGDTMEIYLMIEDERITDISFHTDGCGATRACGSAVTFLSKGKTIAELLALSPGHIINHLQGLPKDHIHCGVLAVSTLHKAIVDYLLKY